MKSHALNNQEYELLFGEFDRFIRIRGYGNGKPVCYQNNIREFLWFIEKQEVMRINDVKAPQVIAYYEYISSRPNTKRDGKLSSSMIAQHLFTLRIFFDYLIDCGQIENSPARLPKFQLPKYTERNICTLNEIKLLYSNCKNKRDTALLSVAYGCGLRRNEMFLLNTSDVIIHKGILIVRAGKYNKSRTITLSEKVIVDLRNYIVHERAQYFRSNNIESSQAFFINNKGGRMSGQILNMLLKKLIKRADNPKLQAKNITLHCLRHSIATHLSNNGAPIEFIQQFLGHSEIDTAYLYAKRSRRRFVG